MQGHGFVHNYGNAQGAPLPIQTTHQQPKRRTRWRVSPLLLNSLCMIAQRKARCKKFFRERRWAQRTGACGRPRAHRAHHPVALPTRRPNPDSRMLAASEATTPSSHRSSSRRPNLSRSVRTPSQNAYNMQISPRSISGATLCAQAREAPAEDGERGCGGLRYTVRASTRGTLVTPWTAP